MNSQGQSKVYLTGGNLHVKLLIIMLWLTSEGSKAALHLFIFTFFILAC